MSTKTMSSAPQPPVGSTASRQAGLPVKHDLRLAYSLSLLLALLSDRRSRRRAPVPAGHLPHGRGIPGLCPGGPVLPSLRRLPILLISMWLARRGKLAACSAGPVCFFMSCTAMSRTFVGVPFGPLFLPYLLLIVLSACAVIALVASMEHEEAVRLRLAGTAKATGIFLIVITSLFVLLAVSEIITAAANQSPVEPLQRALWIADLATIAPAALAGGILLLRRKAPGYASAPGLLLAYGLLFLGLLPVMVFQGLYRGAAVSVTGLLMMLVLGLISVVLLALFWEAPEELRRPTRHLRPSSRSSHRALAECSIPRYRSVTPAGHCPSASQCRHNPNGVYLTFPEFCWIIFHGSRNRPRPER